MRTIRSIERLAWIVGILLVAVWGAVRVHGFLLSRRDLRRFEEARSKLPVVSPERPQDPPPPALPREPAPLPTLTLPDEQRVDSTLWSAERKRAYAESLKQAASVPLALLRIPKIGLEVAVLDGTDDLTLNRAVGWIEDTAKPGEPGNVGIAGHRDGFFRGLKDVAKGDSMELVTLAGSETYRVENIWIVDPADVQVLDPTPTPVLTLVACYPFYFVGSAPKRYIVRASLVEAAAQPTPAVSRSQAVP